MIFRFVFLVFCLGLALETSAQEICSPLPPAKLNAVFKRLALKQLQLEFGPKVEVAQFRPSPIGQDLIRMDFVGRYIKPGRAEYSEDPLSGWITRCRGTVIFRGHTWLASGELDVPRFTREQLLGTGVKFGNPKAKTHVIAFVDSRCSQCHRLISYAKELIKNKSIYIEFIQVAYLESVEEAVQDTQLVKSRLILGKRSNISDEEYLDMISGFAADEQLIKDKNYNAAINMIKQNTQTAKQLLNIRLVPGVLVSDRDSPRQYRLAAFWEMNRIFQPNL